MSTVLIETKKLTKDFVNGDIVTQVLKGVDLIVENGEFLAIMGPSGSGKSTLMHIIGFLDTLTGGNYIFDGKDVSGFGDDQLAHLRNNEVGFIFQNFNLLPRTTVLENVMLPLIYSKVKNKKEKAKSVIQSVGLEHRMYNLSNQLSGGERQRVAIARALVNEPQIIFADEPTGNLDSKTGQQIMKIIQDLNDSGKTIILVTHEQDTAEHSKRIIRLRDGVIEQDINVKKRRFAQDGELKK